MTDPHPSSGPASIQQPNRQGRVSSLVFGIVKTQIHPVVGVFVVLFFAVNAGIIALAGSAEIEQLGSDIAFNTQIVKHRTSHVLGVSTPFACSSDYPGSKNATTDFTNTIIGGVSYGNQNLDSASTADQQLRLQMQVRWMSEHDHNGVICIPPGRYSIDYRSYAFNYADPFADGPHKYSIRINPTDNVTIKGAGNYQEIYDARISAGDSESVSAAYALANSTILHGVPELVTAGSDQYNQMFSVGSGGDLSLEQLTLEGPGDEYTGQWGFDFENPGPCHIIAIDHNGGCKEGTGTTAVVSYGGGATVTLNHIYSTRWGIVVDEGSSATPADRCIGAGTTILLKNSYFSSSGIAMHGRCGSYTAFSNTFRYIGQPKAYLYRWSDGYDGYREHAFYVSYSMDKDIHDNYFDDNYGFSLQDYAGPAYKADGSGPTTLRFNNNTVGYNSRNGVITSFAWNGWQLNGNTFLSQATCDNRDGDYCRNSTVDGNPSNLAISQQFVYSVSASNNRFSNTGNAINSDGRGAQGPMTIDNNIFDGLDYTDTTHESVSTDMVSVLGMGDAAPNGPGINRWTLTNNKFRVASQASTYSCYYNPPYSFCNPATFFNFGAGNTYSFTDSSSPTALQPIRTPKIIGPLFPGPYNHSVSVLIYGDYSGVTRYTLDGSNPGSSSTIYDHAIRLTSSGVYTLKTKSFRGGQTGSTASRTFCIMVSTCPGSPSDTTPPLVSISSPSPGAALSGTATLTADASDASGIDRVQFKVDGNPVGPQDTSSPYSYSLDTASLSNGSHTITAQAWDIPGNTATSSGVPVTVSNTGQLPPSISSFTANPTSITSGGSSTLSWSVSGASPTSLTIDQGVGSVLGLTSKQVSPTLTTTYTITAQNSAGSDSKPVTVTVNGIPPVNQPPNGSLDGVDTAAAKVFGWSNDPDNLSSPVNVHLYFDKNAGTSGAVAVDGGLANQSRSDLSGPYAFNYTIPANSSLRDGLPHKVYVWALDLTDPAKNAQLTVPVGAAGRNPDNSISFTLPVTVPPQPLSDFSDDFNDNTRDASKWNIGLFTVTPSSSASVAEQNQRLEITPPVNSTGYTGYVTAGPYNFTGKGASFSVITPPANVWTELFLGTDVANWASMTLYNGQIFYQYKTAGSSIAGPSPDTFSPGQTLYLRIRHNSSSNALLWETSPDGNTWTTKRSQTLPGNAFSLGAVRVELRGGASLSQPAPGKAIFDNFVLGTPGVTPPQQVAAPIISPNPGAYSTAQNITLSTATSGATIRYTTDGTTPTSSSGTIYTTTTPFLLSTTATVKAIAYSPGMTDSTVTQGFFTITIIDPPVNQPPIGNLDPVDTGVGKVFGWSSDPNHVGSSIQVHLYFDKNAGTAGATPIVITASDPRSDLSGPYAFNYTIPATSSLRDGSPHQVWVWGIDPDVANGSANVQLPGSPRAFTIALAPPAPTITSFTANPASITQGSSAALSWQTSGTVTSVSINNGVGSGLASSGSVTVFPTTTTVYTITASGPGGTSAPASATVTVNGIPPDPAPTASLSAVPSVITLGQTSVLTWSATHASSVSINNGVGSGLGSSGSVTVAPTTTTTYTLTASGTGGSVTATAQVTVNPAPNPAPTVIFLASATTITQGQPVTFTWSVANANSNGISINNNVGSNLAPAGSVTITPGSTATYTLTAVGLGGTTTSAPITVTVTPPIINLPPQASIAASPTSIVGGSGQKASLSWSATNAASVSIDNGVGSNLALTGSIDVMPATTTTYKVTAIGSGGTIATASVTVTVTPSVIPGEPTALISAAPTSITAGSGGSATLSWTATNATSVSIDHNIGNGLPLSGAVSVSPPATTTYTLTVTGGGVTKTASVIVTVTPASTTAPKVTLVATPGAITAGQTSTLAWASANATTVTIDQTIGRVDAAGSKAVTPTTTTTYTITATGAGGTARATATVTITGTTPVPPGPTPGVVLPANVIAGQVIKFADNPTVYLVQSTGLYPFPNFAIFESYRNVSGATIILRAGTVAPYTVSSATAQGIVEDYLRNHAQPAPGSFATNSLVNDSGTIYYIYGTQKVGFTSLQAFLGLGFALKDVVSGNTASYPAASGYTLSSSTQAHPWGLFLRRDKTIYYASEAGMVPIATYELFLANGGSPARVVAANQADLNVLAQNPSLPLLTANDPRVVR